MANHLKLDPTRTTMLRRTFMADMRRRFGKVSAAMQALLVDDDALGSLTPPQHLTLMAEKQVWRFKTDAQKLIAFREWLQQQIDQNILSVAGGIAGKPWTSQYIESAYKKGMVNAYVATRSENIFQKADFQKGGQAEFLRGSFAQPESLSKIELLYTRNFSELVGITDYMSQQMSRIMANGLAGGQGPLEIARDLRGSLDSLTKTRAETLARSEIIAAHAEGQLDAFEALGVEEVGVEAEISTAGDDHVCDECAALEGVVLTIEEARGLIPRHPNCILGDSIVDAPDVVAAMSGNYSGQVIKIATAKGRVITVTENHILLTQFGFVPAKFLYQGLHLVDAPVPDNQIINGPDNNGNKLCIADVFTSLRESTSMFSMSMPLSPENLHGDGRSFDSEICVVRPDSKLRDQFNPTIRSQSIEDQLPIFQLGYFKSSLARCSSFAEFFKSIAFAADSSMGLCRDGLAILLGGILKTNNVSLASSTWLNAILTQATANGVSGTMELLRDCLNAHPILKQFQRLIDWDRNTFSNSGTVDFDASLFKSVLDSVAFNAHAFGNMGDTFSGKMSFDRVVNIECFHVANTPVFDLFTKSTIYSVNGVLSSNCRCSFKPALKDRKEAGQIRTKGGIRRAITESVKAETPGADTNKEAVARSTWAGKELLN